MTTKIPQQYTLRRLRELKGEFLEHWFANEYEKYRNKAFPYNLVTLFLDWLEQFEKNEKT